MTNVFSPDTPLSAYEQHGGSAKFNRGSKNGVHVKFDNGWTVSIQYGPGTYSDNHDEWHDIGNDDFNKPSNTAELACWFDEPGGEPHGEMAHWSTGDSVEGYLTWDQVQEILGSASAGTLTDPVLSPRSVEA